MRLCTILLLALLAATSWAAPKVWLVHSDVPEALMVSNDSGAEVKGCTVEWQVIWENGRHYTEIAMVGLPADGEVKVADCGDWWDERASKTLDVALRLLGPDKAVLAEQKYEGVFKSVPRVGIPTDGWTAIASHGQGNVGKAFDGDQGSRWDTGAKQEVGQWYMLDMHQDHRITGLVLDGRRSAEDYPEGIAVWVSKDGGPWRPLADIPDVRDINQRGRIKLTFDPLTARQILVMLKKPHGDHWFWSMHELCVLPEE